MIGRAVLRWLILAAFRCFARDQADFLKRIYGESVGKWDDSKILNTYANLIGREYSEMLEEQRKRGSK